ALADLRAPVREPRRRLAAPDRLVAARGALHRERDARAARAARELRRGQAPERAPRGARGRVHMGELLQLLRGAGRHSGRTRGAGGGEAARTGLARAGPARAGWVG